MAKGLRRALLKHQAKTYKHDRAKALQAAKEQQTKQRAATNKPRNKRAPKRHSRYIVPFNQEDSILLLGEGDFSFAQSLIDVHQLPPSNITATAFDSEPECYAKYEWSKATIHHLREKGVTTLFGVDATKLEAAKKLRGKTWTKLIWNFPHAGKGITDQDRNILSNQELLLGFFKSAAPLLRHGSSNATLNRKKIDSGNDGEDGEEAMDPENEIDGVSEDENSASVTQAVSQQTRGTILVTLRDKHPYTLWDMPRLAKKPPNPNNPAYTQVRSFAFDFSAYQGYVHRRTAGHRGEREIPIVKGGAETCGTRTWVFELRDED